MKEVHEGNTHVMIDSDDDRFECAVLGFVYTFLGAEERGKGNELLEAVLSFSNKLSNERKT